MTSAPSAERRWTWASLAVAGCFAVLLYALLREVLWARTFPLVHDAAILHYVTFMIGRGHAPYLQQVEMNLPGVLMTEWLSMHVTTPPTYNRSILIYQYTNSRNASECTSSVHRLQGCGDGTPPSAWLPLLQVRPWRGPGFVWRRRVASCSRG